MLALGANGGIEINVFLSSVNTGANARANTFVYASLNFLDLDDLAGIKRT